MNENILKQFEDDKKKHDELYHQFLEKMKNPVFAKAYKLKEEAWAHICSKKNYNPDKGLQLIAEATQLNPEYEPQIQGMKNMIERKAKTGKVNIKKAINNLFLPILVKHGFELVNSDSKNKGWKEGAYFHRKIDDIKNTILLGRTKFGHELSVIFFKQQENCSLESFNFRSIGIFPHKDFEYLNQNELELVIIKIVLIFNENIVPWLEKTK
jgi:hypothetical protein